MQVWSLISLHERHMNCAIARRDQAELLSRVQKPYNGAKDFTNLHSFFFVKDATHS